MSVLHVSFVEYLILLCNFKNNVVDEVSFIKCFQIDDS